jgi:hypothetical protein
MKNLIKKIIKASFWLFIITMLTGIQGLILVCNGLWKCEVDFIGYALFALFFLIAFFVVRLTSFNTYPKKCNYSPPV